MNSIFSIVFLSLAGLAFAESNTPLESAKLSPAEVSIAAAKQEIQKKPTYFAGYNHLAIALSRRARETSNVDYYAQAEDALKKSQDLAPSNLEAEKIRVWLLLG